MYNNPYGDSIVNIDSYKNNNRTKIASADQMLKNIQKSKKRNVIDTTKIVQDNNINNIKPIQ